MSTDMATHQCPHCKSYSRDNELHIECAEAVAKAIMDEQGDLLGMPRKRIMKTWPIKYGDEHKTHKFTEEIPDSNPGMDLEDYAKHIEEKQRLTGRMRGATGLA